MPVAATLLIAPARLAVAFAAMPNPWRLDGAYGSRKSAIQGASLPMVVVAPWPG
jgi:hypothetical protein